MANAFCCLSLGAGKCTTLARAGAVRLTRWSLDQVCSLPWPLQAKVRGRGCTTFVGVRQGLFVGRTRRTTEDWRRQLAQAFAWPIAVPAKLRSSSRTFVV